MLEFALLLDDLNVAQRERSALAKASELAVGEHSRRRGVTGTFEAVQCAAGSEPLGSELIDDHDVPTKLRHPREFGEYAAGALCVVQNAPGASEFERVGGKRERRRVGEEVGDIRWRASTRLGKHFGDEIDAHHRGDVAGEGDRKRAGAGADIECPLDAVE